MKLKFNPNLDFQLEAVNAVADLFEGQEMCQTNFTVGAVKGNLDSSMLQPTAKLGIGNRPGCSMRMSQQPQQGSAPARSQAVHRVERISTSRWR